MNETIYKTANFRDKKISVKHAITILAKNNIEVNEAEATLILDFLYHIAATFQKYNNTKSDLNP